MPGKYGFSSGAAGMIQQNPSASRKIPICLGEAAMAHN